MTININKMNIFPVTVFSYMIAEKVFIGFIHKWFEIPGGPNCVDQQFYKRHDLLF